MPQLALAWLLHRSRVMLPIPGTSSPAHLGENLAAASNVAVALMWFIPERRFTQQPTPPR